MPIPWSQTYNLPFALTSRSRRSWPKQFPSKPIPQSVNSANLSDKLTPIGECICNSVPEAAAAG